MLQGSRLEVGAAPATKSVRGLVIKTLVNRHGVRDPLLDHDVHA